MNTDVSILRALGRAGPEGVSGAALARDLGISRAAVWNRIEDLRRHGYRIEASPHQGYVLRAGPSSLHPDDLMSRLDENTVIGREIRVYQATDSTNDLIDRWAHGSGPEGMVVFAETQNQGRGRLGRKWVSPPGSGLWFSVLLRPRMAPQAATQLTILSAVALARAIESETDLQPSIKWPNDIVFGNRKAGGILLELRAELDRIRHVVLGIGLNVCVPPEAWPPELQSIVVSLQDLTSQPIDRASLAATILSELNLAYLQWQQGGFHRLSDEWMRRCSTLGKHLTIRMGDRILRGRAESLDEEGALLVRTEHGHLDRIMGGDITLDGPGGGEGRDAT
jgi:BirA family biotin operon repressor/biotin-[acetyl-CoA-carboxylase] ligase